MGQVVYLPGVQPEPPQPAESPREVEGRLAYRWLRLDGPLGEFHRAVDQLEADSVPLTYFLKVKASQARRRVRVTSSRGGGR